MLLAQGRYWRTARAKATGEIQVGFVKDELPDEFRELKEFRLEIPVDRWNRIVKHVRSDRKLFGGVVLEFVNQEEQLSVVLANDRLYGELQRVVQETTSALVENGALALAVVDVGAE